MKLAAQRQRKEARVRISGVVLSLAGLALWGALASAQQSSPPTPATTPTQAEDAQVQALLTRLAAIDVSDAAFRKLDADHDGRISALEANANPKVAERFLEADRNHDGYLSLEEFRSLGKPATTEATPLLR